VVGFGGDVSDMQYLDRLLTSLDTEEAYGSSGHTLNAKNLHSYLAKVFYKRRSDFDPLWNQVLVGGLDEHGKPFLASADLLGTTFSSPSLATGFGAHLAQPLLRKVAFDEEAAAKLSREDAVEAIKESMKVLFYRDARSLDKYSIAVITKDGIDLKENEKLENQSWALYVILYNIYDNDANMSQCRQDSRLWHTGQLRYVLPLVYLYYRANEANLYKSFLTI
jgi:20S proteasome subunit beta 7